MCISGGIPVNYQQRRPEKTTLYGLVKDNYKTFLLDREEECRTVAPYIRREFEQYLRCGILAYGFGRFYCSTCKKDLLVPFSCKKRGFCSSCCSRRMAETAIHLVDNVIPEVPVRQFVVTFPVQLRLWMSRNSKLLADVCQEVNSEISEFIIEKSDIKEKVHSKTTPNTGLAVFVQRFGSALNLNIHFHILAIDGVFVEKSTGRLKFYSASAPSDDDIEKLILKISKRVNNYLLKKGFLEEVEGQLLQKDSPTLFEPDDLHLPAMASSLINKIAFGENAGKSVRRLYAGTHKWPEEEDSENKGARCSASGGYSLHANTSIKSHEKDRLEKLIRYMSRPPFSDDSLHITESGNVRIKLKSAWRDGTTHIEVTPLEFIEKLAALIPLPKSHTVRYFGVLSSNSKHRDKLVPHNNSEVAPIKRKKKSYINWADLLKRTFKIDILKCETCGNNMQLISVVEDFFLIEATMTALGLDPKPPNVRSAVSRTLFYEDFSN